MRGHTRVRCTGEGTGSAFPQMRGHGIEFGRDANSGEAVQEFGSWNLGRCHNTIYHKNSESISFDNREDRHKLIDDFWGEYFDERMDDPES